MKTFRKVLILFFAALPLNIAIANDDITGLWQGMLVIGPDTELVIQFNIGQDASGSYTAVLNTPDGGTIENVKADSVDFNAGNLKISVAELSESYEGIFTFKIETMRKFKGKPADAKIIGEINLINFPDAMGSSITLVKGEYKAPVYNLNLPKEIKEQLSGKWNDILKMQAMQTISMAVEFRFETSENKDFSGFEDMPGKGGSGLPITDANMSDGKLFLAVKSLRGEFIGEIIADKLVGDWSQTGGGSTPMTLNRGGYVAPE